MRPLVVVPELESELDHLFELPPAEFTSARNDLARRLKGAGQSDAAAQVQALRKPTIPVWTINQLARRHPDEIATLITASDQLRAAQEAALVGDEQERLRTATSAERQAVRSLTDHAHDVLKGAVERPTAALLERVVATLRAAALDVRARELLLAGMLVEELEAAGFGAFEGIQMPARRKTPRRAPKQAGAAEERRRKERIRKLRERARNLAAAAADAESEAERAEAEAARERRKADRAAAAAERARLELDAAEGKPAE